MRRGTLALTLAFALGVCGVLSAEEDSGNWLTRLFTRSAEKKTSAKSSTAKDNPVLPNYPLIQAQANLARRRDVCQRLLEIALQTNDDDLSQKAEQLELRAYELYQATRNRAKTIEQPIGTVSKDDLKAAQKSAKGVR